MQSKVSNLVNVLNSKSPITFNNSNKNEEMKSSLKAENKLKRNVILFDNNDNINNSSCSFQMRNTRLPLMCDFDDNQRTNNRNLMGNENHYGNIDYVRTSDMNRYYTFRGNDDYLKPFGVDGSDNKRSSQMILLKERKDHGFDVNLDVRQKFCYDERLDNNYNNMARLDYNFSFQRQSSYANKSHNLTRSDKTKTYSYKKENVEEKMNILRNRRSHAKCFEKENRIVKRESKKKVRKPLVNVQNDTKVVSAAGTLEQTADIPEISNWVEEFFANFNDNNNSYEDISTNYLIDGSLLDDFHLINHLCSEKSTCEKKIDECHSSLHSDESDETIEMTYSDCTDFIDMMVVEEDKTTTNVPDEQDSFDLIDQIIDENRNPQLISNTQRIVANFRL